jgi:AcrR family transcriptional regulator
MSKKSDRTRQRIVEAAGVPRGNIYYYFKTKDEILQSAIDYRMQRIETMLETWNGSYRTPIERLHRFLDILSNSADAIMRYGCPMGTLNTELGKDQGELQEQAENLFRIFEDWLSDQFAELGYAGQARELALRLMAFGQGINVMAHVHSDPAFLRREKERLGRWLDRLAEGDDDCA